MYYLAFPSDSIRNKLFVYLVFAIEILQTVVITKSAFHVFAVGYGNFSYYNAIDLAWLDVPVVSGVVAFLAEIFYAYRIMLLAQSYWVPCIIFILAIVQLAGAIASAVVLKQAVTFSRLLGPHFFITAGIWNGGSALCDVIIAVCMTYYLSRHMPDSMHDTQVLLKKVMTLVIETGTATAAIAILNLVLAVLPSRPSYYQVPSEILAKVYSNSMMVLLNSRMSIGTSSSVHERTHVSRFRTEPFAAGMDTNAIELGERVTIAQLEADGQVRTKEDRHSPDTSV
ncbi:hypothetical protein CVT26_006338 [Gymnopilus dilepis]|uniref:DUF6534 domain-containing protein n=1 Tax=Gymnopilus dilepis TaxID=231916 RepID=A0A409Y0P2_9AGAR|nr:hypothetical protein CVT26_006338 [Gymnopilus dilepis]